VRNARRRPAVRWPTPKTASGTRLTIGLFKFKKATVRRAEGG